MPLTYIGDAGREKKQGIVDIGEEAGTRAVEPKVQHSIPK